MGRAAVLWCCQLVSNRPSRCAGELDLPGDPPRLYGRHYDRSRSREAHDDDHERTTGPTPASRGRQSRRHPSRAARGAVPPRRAPWEWEMEVSFEAGYFGPGSPPVAGRGGRTRFTWLDGEFFLIQRFTAGNPTAPSGIAITGPGE